MRIAVEGCCHDELEIIYDVLEHIQHLEDTKIDLLLMCGDFEATRNPDDLMCMAVPAKYRDMKYFYKYYKGEKKAPILTIVIGGNHEASNYMQELPYGGWLAPNIYYLGYAGIVNVGGLRIGGISGIYKGCDYHKGHFEKPPYTDSAMRSCYHTRSLEVFRLKQVYKDVDIMLSHDWPLHAVQAGNKEQLCRYKPHFRDEIMQNTLGSPAAQEVLTHIKPKYWFSAHLHCKYSAVIKHRGKGEDKITKFLALDKCLPKRSFLQVLDLPSSMEPPYKIQLDAEWLVILKNTNHLLNITDSARYMPGVGCKERYDFKVKDAEITKLLEDFGGDLTLPENFQITAQPYDGTSDKRKGRQPMCRVNPQTTLLCQMLGITDPFAVFCGQSNEENPEEINIDSETSDGTQDTSEPEDAGTTTAESDVETVSQESLSVDDSMHDTTSSEQFPTFMHSQSIDENFLHDEVSSSNCVEQFTPSRDSCAMDTTKSDQSPIKLSPMMLPSPKVGFDSSCNELSDVPNIQIRKRCSDDGPSKPSSMDVGLDNAGKISNDPVKKFKRRNLAVYSILTNEKTEDSEPEPT